ncbi:hypothetical protein LC612_29435 [Nostoc sp. CHAB 5834]|nr:hypothetical protein [Nostoc sp. CHAB 5834]
MTPLNHYYGLLGLMLHEGELGCRFDLKGVRCEIGEIEGHATFIAASPEFAIALVFPGWYIGDTSTTPVHIDVKGNLSALFSWLPLPPADKRNIIKHLTIGKEAKVLTLLSI